MSVYAMAAAMLVLAACATSDPPRRGYDSNPTAGVARIFVTNLNFMEVTVYGVTTGTRRRLGVVPGKGEKMLTMPISFPTELHLEIDILAGPYCWTERLTVDAGDDFDLVVQQAGSNLNCRTMPRSESEADLSIP
jgi:hypothetical protein